MSLPTLCFQMISKINELSIDTLRFQQSVQQKDGLGATQKDPRIRQWISTFASANLLLLQEVSLTLND